jgi:hypothetical protein
MRRIIIRLVVGTPLALLTAAAVAIAAVPPVRHAVSGLWNSPEYLPALPDNKLVHYEPGAEAYARDVAGLISEAMARVEAVHGRPFAHPVTVGVYATPEAFAAANGLGSNVPVGVTFHGSVNLSPKLFKPQHQRLPAILTHELSHAHIQGWIGGIAYLRLPNWFKEGLAVMISKGGGAELVSEEQARAAIERGEMLAIEDAGSLWHVAEVRLEKEPANKPPWYSVVLAYREAGMFVGYLREKDKPAFDRLITAILDGRPFADAMSLGYHDDVQSLWREFIQSGSQIK